MASGLFLAPGSYLQFPTGSIRFALDDHGSLTDVEVDAPLVRFDLWPTWLDIGCTHAAEAQRVNRRLIADPNLTDDAKGALLTQELKLAMVAMVAFAVSFDGFYDVVNRELGPHPNKSAWVKNRTRRDLQIVETLKYHLTLAPIFVPQLQDILRQLNRFRSSAVHPASKSVVPILRPDLDVGVHPHLVTFSGAHAVQCRGLMLAIFDHLLEKTTTVLAPEKISSGWTNFGAGEVKRLIEEFPLVNDKVAFSDVDARPEQPGP